jgi:hypothetical protein
MKMGLSRLMLVWGAIGLLSQLAFAAPVKWEQNGHWYEVIVVGPPGEISWPAAKAAAEEKGGYLATLTSAEENTFVFNLTVSTPGAWHSSAEWMIGPWIGGSDAASEGNWQWVTGEPWAYTNWLSGQPDNWEDEDYLIFWGRSTITPTWNDADIANGYVIEYDSLIHISSIDPSSGAPGIRATISGQNFLAPCVLEWVTFGSQSLVHEISWTDQEIIVQVPYPTSSGEQTVEVTVHKTAPTQESNSVLFTYKKPQIVEITPPSATPKTEVVIRGQNFGVPPKKLPEGYGIRFGLSSASYWKSWTDTEIVVRAPKDYGTGDTDAQVLKWIVKVLLFGWQPGIPAAIAVVIEELIDQGIVRPAERQTQVNVIVTTPVGDSNAQPFTYTVP